MGMLEIREKMATMQEASGLKEWVVAGAGCFVVGVVIVVVVGDAVIPLGKGTQLALKVVMARVLVLFLGVQGSHAPVLAVATVRG